MKFSALLSLYHSEKPESLNQCLSSLYNQTVKADEVILVIDGPISETLFNIALKWKQDLNIKIYPLEKNMGLGKALNYGLNHCNYELVARMDTDDICLPNRFSQQLEFFDNNPSFDICGSHIEEFEEENLTTISVRKVGLTNTEILKQLPYRNPFNHMTVMYKKSSIIKVGGYQHLPWMEDWYLWLRLLNNGFKGANLDCVLVKARTGQNMLLRRRGKKYVKSEWDMTKHKINYGLIPTYLAIFIFFKRALPRIFPKYILRIVYALSRRK